MTPNPGSPAALMLGCLCGCMDNDYGRGIPWPREDGLDPEKNPSFWIAENCPMHGAQVEEDDERQALS